MLACTSFVLILCLLGDFFIFLIIEYLNDDTLLVFTLLKQGSYSGIMICDLTLFSGDF